MPRHARLFRPHMVHHAIARFVNGVFRIRDERYRAEYFDQLGRAIARCDWDVISACAMCSHAHLGLFSGLQPAEHLFRSLHTRYAMWLNKTDGVFGPVYAERPWLVAVEGEAPLALIAYHHNNPVHAGVVQDPADSTWSTHRAYIGLEPAPPWLDVARGLSLCGFDSSPSGRVAFHDAVRARIHDPVPEIFRGETQTAIRRRVRAACGATVETATPLVHAVDCAPRVEIVARAPGPTRPRWQGEVHDVVRVTAATFGLRVEVLQSCSRLRAVVRARRVALAAWVAELNRFAREMACALGLSEGAAAHLRAQALSPEDASAAKQIADLVRAAVSKPLVNPGRN